MSLLRVYAFAAIAAGLVQAAAAAPVSTIGPAQGDIQLLHLMHGRHSACIRGHRHRWDGLPLRCGWQDDDDDDDDGDDGDDDCVQIGPVQVCQ